MSPRKPYAKTTPLLMQGLFSVVLALFAVAALAQETGGFAKAKAKADADEASLSAAEMKRLLTVQGELLAQLAATCATPRPDTSPFVVVMELDADGRVINSWRHGATPLAICFQKNVANQMLTPPPRTPFHTSLELTFTR
jgi:hypothetical protein